MTYSMFLDDVRDPCWVYPHIDSSQWQVCRSAAEAQSVSVDLGCPVWISFDHDLGEHIPTGFDFARWLINSDLDHQGKWMPADFSFEVHSANPVGAANIKGLLDNYLRTRP